MTMENKPSERIMEIYREMRVADKKTGVIAVRFVDAIMQYLDEQAALKTKHPCNRGPNCDQC